MDAYEEMIRAMSDQRVDEALWSAYYRYDKTAVTATTLPAIRSGT